MDVSTNGRRELTILEGSKAEAYQDSVHVWTIGVGHTAAAGPPIPRFGMSLTQAQIDSTLANDLTHIYQPAVVRHLTREPKQHQFDALVSFAFNVGEGNFAKSNVLKLFNDNKTDKAGEAFLAWNKAGGRVLGGLTNRRKIEKAMFLSGVYPGVPLDRIAAAGDDPLPVLKIGAHGATVKTLQTDLEKLHYYNGKQDGDFGPLTRLAVQAFQRNSNLDSDAIVGYKTWTALDIAVGRAADMVA